MTSRERDIMNKFLSRATAFLGAGALAISLTACGGGGTGDASVLIVGASPTPHAKILKYLQDSGAAEKAGITIKVKEFSDYITPNEALKAGDIDANYYQTVPYLEEQSASRGYKFTAGKGIHLEPVGVYSSKIKSLDELKDGAKIAVINDPSNQARQLNLLAANDLLQLKGMKDVSVVNVKAKPAANPHGFQFTEVDGASEPSLLPDVDIAVINGNYAQGAGLKPSDALALEDPKGNPALNVLVWRADEKDKLEAIKKLDELLHSDVTKKYIEDTWPDQSVLPAF